MELLEIEKELAGPARREAMERYDAILVALDARVQGALAEGVPPDEYSRCEALRDAVVTARKLLRIQIKQRDLTEERSE